MLKLLASGVISNFMLLSRHEGRLSTGQVALNKDDVSSIIRNCETMASAFASEAPASQPALKLIVKQLNDGTTNLGVYHALERARTTIGAEMTQRHMYILMPGQKLDDERNDQKPSPLPTPASGGGRPSKSFWEDLWAEMARQLYEGDLKPNKQVDIENAMNNWLAKHGHSAGETQVRERARKLFKSISK